jgi:hypothetical protein
MGSMDGGGDPQVLHGRNQRFRSDDFGEAGSGFGWLGAINADVEMPQNFAATFRFRFCATNEGGAESGRTVKLYKSFNLGAWTSVAQLGSWVQVDTTDHFGDKDPATDFGDANDLYDDDWADVANQWLCRNNNLTGTCNFSAGQPTRMESEWSLKLIPSTLTVDDTISFRGHGAAGGLFTDGYDVVPASKIIITPAVAHPEAWFVKHNRAVLSRIVAR